MLDHSIEPRAPCTGDRVQLKEKSLDNRVATVLYVYVGNKLVYLSLPLRGSTIWEVSDLVRVAEPDSSQGF